MKNTLIIILMFLVVISAVYEGSVVHAEESLERLIEIDRYGFTYVVDRVSIPDSRDYVEIGFPKNLIQNLVDFYSPSGKLELIIEDQFFWIKVSGKGGEIILKTIFGDMLQLADVDNFKLTFPLNPVTREDLGGVKVTLTVPSGSSIVRFSSRDLEIGEEKMNISGTVSLDTTKTQNLEVVFSKGSMSLLRIPLTQVKLDLESGEVEYVVKMNLREGSTLDSFTFNLPEGSKFIEARDQLRKLQANFNGENNELRVSFDRVLQISEIQTISVRFKPPAETFYKLENSKLTIKPILLFNLSTPSYELIVVLRSMEYISSNLEPYRIVKEYPEKTLLYFNLGITSPLTISQRIIEIDVKQFFSFYSAAPYLAASSLIILIIGILLYRTTLVVKPLPTEQLEKIKKFIELTETMLSLYMILEELISSRKILERSYIRTRLLEIKNSTSRNMLKILSLSTDIKKTTSIDVSRIDKIVGGLRDFEKMVENMWSLCQKYLSGSVGKATYLDSIEKMQNEFRKNVKEISEEIEILKKTLH